MHAAAVALLAGVANPLRDYLALSPADRVYMDAIVSKSIELREAEHKSLADYHARETAGRVINGFASVMRSAVKVLVRRR